MGNNQDILQFIEMAKKQDTVPSADAIKLAEMLLALRTYALDLERILRDEGDGAVMSIS